MSTLTKKEAIKQNWGNFFIFFAICVGCVVGHFFIKSDWKYALLFFGAVALWLAFSGLIKGFQKINRSFCKNCGAYINYNNDNHVSWRVENRRIVGTKVYFTVYFECTCPDCGRQRFFTKDMLLASYDKDTNTIEERDPYEWAKDLFWTEKDQ